MLSKYLRQRFQQLSMSQTLTARIQKVIAKIDRKSGANTIKDITRAGRLLLQVVQSAEKDENKLVISQIIFIIKDLIMQVHNDNHFEVYLIKIRTFLISISLERQAKIQSIKISIKIKLFLQSLQHSALYPLIQEDIYGHLEQVYLQAIQINLQIGKPQQALRYANLCYETMRKQLNNLFELSNKFAQQKIDIVIEKKANKLELLFGLQFGARYASSQLSSDQILGNMYPKYERLFTRASPQKRKEYYFEKADKLIKAVQELQVIFEAGQIKEQPDIQKSEYSITNSSFKEPRNSFQTHAKYLGQSIQFIDGVQRRSLSAASSSLQRTSIRIQSEQTISKKKKSLPHRNLQIIPNNEQESISSQEKLSNTENNHQKENLFPLFFQPKKVIKPVLKINRNFSLVNRGEQIQRQRIRTLNPWPMDKKNNQQIQLRNNRDQMLKCGIFF